MIQLIVYTGFLLSCQSDGEVCASSLGAVLRPESALPPSAENVREREREYRSQNVAEKDRCAYAFHYQLKREREQQCSRRVAWWYVTFGTQLSGVGSALE